LNVRCTHSPAWPQAGQAVTIKAEALDASLEPVLLTDNIEIWVDTQDGPKVSGPSSFGRETYIYGPAGDGGDFDYGCRVQDGDGSIFSGWRTVAQGVTGFGGAIPVGLAQGDVTRAIDVVFIPDQTNYGPSDPMFIADVGRGILGYFEEPLFLRNQSKFNFWISPNTGDGKQDYDSKRSEDGAGADTCGDVDSNGDAIDNGNDGRANRADLDCAPCVLTAPAGWATIMAFADVGAIIHREQFRDCARGSQRLFSAWTDWPLERVLRHETGHTPFGLADEYCCDGGYFQDNNDPFMSNMYSSLIACQNDTQNVGRPGTACRQLSRYFPSLTEDLGPESGPCDDGIDNAGDGLSDATDPDCINTRNWWTSDPALDDLMVDNRTPQALDVRRINWKFSECDAGRC
jgi:hypothetical protein